MPRRFLSEREGKRGGGLIDPFVNLERDVELEAIRRVVSRGLAPCACDLVFSYFILFSVVARSIYCV